MTCCCAWWGRVCTPRLIRKGRGDLGHWSRPVPHGASLGSLAGLSWKGWPPLPVSPSPAHLAEIFCSPHPHPRHKHLSSNRVCPRGPGTVSILWICGPLHLGAGRGILLSLRASRCQSTQPPSGTYALSSFLCPGQDGGFSCSISLSSEPVPCLCQPEF